MKTTTYYFRYKFPQCNVIWMTYPEVGSLKHAKKHRDDTIESLKKSGIDSSGIKCEIVKCTREEEVMVD